MQQPVASNCFGIRCQRQHWTGPAPRKCRLRLRGGTEREGEVRRTDPSPAPTLQRGPKAARARVRGLFGVSLRPEVGGPGLMTQETQVGRLHAGGDVLGRVRPLVNSDPKYLRFSFRDTEWLRPRRSTGEF